MQKTNLKNLTVVAGPCAAETEEQVLQTAQMLSEMGVKIFRAGVWKPRSRPADFQGVGVEGLRWLQKVKEQTAMQVATEVATAEHVELSLNHHIDILWLGARTVSNPFSVQEIADSLRGTDIHIMVKNPISADLGLWTGAIERLQNAGIQQITAIHRGFSQIENSLYRNAPRWNIPIELRRRLPQLPLLCDPSHIGGKAERVAAIAQQALDLNFDGLFVESHCCPKDALSDVNQQITPENLSEILHSLVQRKPNSTVNFLQAMRREIDEIDENLLALLADRMQIAEKIGAFKKTHNISVLQANRYVEMLQNRLTQAQTLNLSPRFVEKIWEIIHEESIEKQI